MNDQNIIVTIFGMIIGIIIPVAALIYLYYKGRGKREIVLEISKNLDEQYKFEELLKIFEERKKEPIDYRRGGVITIFVCAGLYLLDFLALGNILEVGGVLISFIGIGTMIAGYLYPNTGEELSKAIEEPEKK